MNGYSDDIIELADRGDDRPGIEDADEFELDEAFDEEYDDGDEAELDETEPSEELDEDEDEYDDDYPEDATEEDIDLTVALYREDGQPVAVALPKDLANDLDELIENLRRFPADGGTLGLVSVASEFFVICRVRGRHVQVLLSDAVCANDWPIARDVVDFLGLELPDEEDEPVPAGDLDILADLGIGEFELESLCAFDDDADQVLATIAKKLKYGPQYTRVVQSAFGL